MKSTIEPPHQNTSGYSRQNQNKRQREWVYLSHYIVTQGLQPTHIISGQDDGHEPDFTLIFYSNTEPYYVGLELTTLPRLRDQMGEEGLIAKRWYWQSWQALATLKRQLKSKQVSSYYGQPPIITATPVSATRLRHPSAFQSPQLTITQNDINAVMAKKSAKITAYHTRRHLDELWLLIHTDKHQPDGIISAVPSDSPLYHDSNFDQVHVTRYPSYQTVSVIQQNHYK